MAREVFAMLEVFASNPVIGLSVTLLMLALLLRAVSFRSWKFHTAFVIAAFIIASQYALRFICNVVALWVLVISVIVYVVFCGCLLIWREKNIPRLTIRQHAIMSMAAVLLYIPAGVMNFDVMETWKCRTNWHEALFYSPAKRIPSEILGMNLLSVGAASGMRRETVVRRIGGNWKDIIYLKDKTPRKVGGSIFSLVRRDCTLKTLTPFSVVAETDLMSCSEDGLVMEKARIIADGIKRDCGFEVKQVWGVSITSSSGDDVMLYAGHGGNLEAEIFCVRRGRDREQCVLRMHLRDAGMWCDSTNNSQIYVESIEAKSD